MAQFEAAESSAGGGEQTASRKDEGSNVSSEEEASEDGDEENDARKLFGAGSSSDDEPPTEEKERSSGNSWGRLGEMLKFASTTTNKVIRSYERRSQAASLDLVATCGTWLQEYERRAKQASLSEEEAWQTWQEVAEYVVLGGGQAAGDISIEEEGSFINCYLLWATELLPRGCGSASSKGDITTLAEEQYRGLRWRDPTKMEYFRTAKAILELWERAASLERYITGSQFPTTRRQIDEATKKWIVCATMQGMDQSSRESAQDRQALSR